MSSQRVVVTGLGAITPIGNTKETYWQQLLAGVSGIRRIQFPNLNMDQYRTRIAASVQDFEVSDYLPADKKNKYHGRATLFALAAARMALEDAGFELCADQGGFRLSGIDPYRVGVILGAAAGNMAILEREFGRSGNQNGFKRFSPHALPNHLMSAVPGSVAIMFNCRGITYVISTSCTSASQAIGNAYRQLQNGEEDIILTGGADSGINPTIFSGFTALKAMSTQNDAPESACRPFDRDRDGFVMGEGAGIIVLEKLEHAQVRQAPIYGEVTGYGSTTDAHHLTVPDPDGRALTRAIRMALAETHQDGAAIHYINAHGTATRLNDVVETRALKQAFGKQVYQIPVSSTKSMTGHLLGAAGGIEFIATVLSMHHGMIPPTINHERPDPECDLDYVPNQMREACIQSAISTSLGFGGFNSALVVSRYEH